MAKTMIDAEAIRAAAEESLLEVGAKTEAERVPTPLPSVLLPVPTLTPKMLPEGLRSWLTDIGHRAQMPIEFGAVPALVALSSLPKNIVVRPKVRDTWIEACNLWGAVVSASGNLKSPIANQATAPVKEIETQLQKEYAEQMPNIVVSRLTREAERNALQAELASSFKAGKKGTEVLVDREAVQERLQSLEAQSDPTPQRLLVGDITIEKLIVLLSENPNGLLSINDELAALFASFKEKPKDRPLYLEMSSGLGSFKVDRMSRSSVHVARMCLSLFGTIQPSIIQQYIQDGVTNRKDDGLTQRLQLLVFPDIDPKFENIDAIPLGVDEARSIYKSLYRFDPAAAGLNRLTEEAGGYYFIQFADDAQTFFNNWFTDHENNLRNGTFGTASLRSHLAKYRGLMPRLAMLFQLVDIISGLDKTPAISKKNAIMAADWCEFLRKHAERLYNMVVRTDIKAAQTIIDKVREEELGRVLTARSIYRKNWSGLTEPRQVKAALELLTEYGWLSEIRTETGGKSAIEYHVEFE